MKRIPADVLADFCDSDGVQDGDGVDGVGENGCNVLVLDCALEGYHPCGRMTT